MRLLLLLNKMDGNLQGAKSLRIVSKSIKITHLITVEGNYLTMRMPLVS